MKHINSLLDSLNLLSNDLKNYLIISLVIMLCIFFILKFIEKKSENLFKQRTIYMILLSIAFLYICRKLYLYYYGVHVTEDYLLLYMLISSIVNGKVSPFIAKNVEIETWIPRVFTRLWDFLGLNHYNLCNTLKSHILDNRMEIYRPRVFTRLWDFLGLNHYNLCNILKSHILDNRMEIHRPRVFTRLWGNYFNTLLEFKSRSYNKARIPMTIGAEPGYLLMEGQSSSSSGASGNSDTSKTVNNTGNSDISKTVNNTGNSSKVSISNLLNKDTSKVSLSNNVDTSSRVSLSNNVDTPSRVSLSNNVDTPSRVSLSNNVDTSSKVSLSNLLNEDTTSKASSSNVNPESPKASSSNVNPEGSNNSSRGLIGNIIPNITQPFSSIMEHARSHAQDNNSRKRIIDNKNLANSNKRPKILLEDSSDYAIKAHLVNANIVLANAKDSVVDWNNTDTNDVNVKIKQNFELLSMLTRGYGGKFVTEKIISRDIAKYAYDLASREFPDLIPSNMKYNRDKYCVLKGAKTEEPIYESMFKNLGFSSAKRVNFQYEKWRVTLDGKEYLVLLRDYTLKLIKK